MWDFHVRSISRSKPWYFRVSNSVTTSSAWAQFTGKYENLMGVNLTLLVYSTFNVTWLAWNHLEMCSITRLNTFIKSSQLVCETRILVSSANVITSTGELICKGKSLMYMSKRRGRMTRPLGTPCLTISQLEQKFCVFEDFSSTSWFLLHKHYLNQCKTSPCVP